MVRGWGVVLLTCACSAGCSGKAVSSDAGDGSGAQGSGSALSSGGANTGGVQMGAGGDTSDTGGTLGSGGRAATGGTGTGSGGAPLNGFIEAEVLGELRHYTRDAQATTQGADEGFIVLGGHLGDNISQDAFFLVVPNTTGTFTKSVYWFGTNGIYYGPCTIEVTSAAPEIGDVMIGTFEGEAARPGETDQIQIANGRFELPRVP